jgi:hypothetical protein
MPTRQPRPSEELPGGNGLWHHYRPAFSGPYRIAIDKPTLEYLEWLSNDLESRGLSITIKDARPTITGPTEALKALPGRIVKSVKEHKPALLEHWKQTRGLDLSGLPPPMPEAGTVVEWCDIDHMTSDPGGLCTAEDLPTRPWWRWRYRRAKRWHAINGDSWEEW